MLLGSERVASVPWSWLVEVPAVLSCGDSASLVSWWPIVVFIFVCLNLSLSALLWGYEDWVIFFSILEGWAR